jgi:hypothetical protein
MWIKPWNNSTLKGQGEEEELAKKNDMEQLRR